MTEKGTPARADLDEHVSEFPLDAVLIWSGIIPMIGLAHWLPTWFAAIPLALAVLIPSLRQRPYVWLASFALWVPLLVVGWSELEDHVYLAVYWVLAVGLALGMSDLREALRLQARVLLGLTFGVAAAWKITSTGFLTGDMFRTVLVSDHRFDFLTRMMTGMGQETIDANRLVLKSFSSAGSSLDPLTILTPGRFGLLVFGLTVWTLLIELTVSVSFLAPTNSVLARLRHPALVMFCATTYAMIPVFGFAMIFPVLGITTTDDQRWHLAYIGVIFFIVTAAGVRAAYG